MSASNKIVLIPVIAFVVALVASLVLAYIATAVVRF